jgi:hypothetical protein
MKACFLILLITSIVTFSCTEEVEIFESDPVTDYIQLQPGKYITYRTDSTVYTNFGRNPEVHSYQEKHVVDATISDAAGRPSYRILRYLRDVAGTQTWRQSGSYLITATEQTIEVSENMEGKQVFTIRSIWKYL